MPSDEQIERAAYEVEQREYGGCDWDDCVKGVEDDAGWLMCSPSDLDMAYEIADKVIALVEQSVAARLLSGGAVAAAEGAYWQDDCGYLNDMGLSMQSALRHIGITPGAALVDELTQAQHDAWPGVDADFTVNTEAIMPIIDRLLAERAAAPDDDAVERAARALYFTDANPDPVKYDPRSQWEAAWEKHLAFYQCEGYDPQGFFPVFELAKKALTAAGPGPDLDAVLDGVPGAYLDSLHDGKRGASSPHWYKEPQPENRWTARVLVRQGQAGHAGYWVTEYTGIGPTRMAAIADAAAKAKGVQGE